MAGGTVRQIPLDGEIVTDLPQGPFSIRPLLGFVDLSPESGREGGGYWATNSAQTPQRSGDGLDAPSP